MIKRNEDYPTPEKSMNRDDEHSSHDEGDEEERHTHRRRRRPGSDDERQSTPLNNDGSPGPGDRNNDSQQRPGEEEEEEEEESQLLFSCQCDSARTIATLLSCLRRVVTASTGTSWSSSAATGGIQNQSSQYGGASSTQRTSATQSTAAAVSLSGGSANKIQHATVYAGPHGLTFHVQHGLAKQSQCSVDMPRGLFREYFVGEEEVWLEDSDAENDVDEEEEDGTTTATTQPPRGGGQKEIVQGGEFGVNLTTVLECFSILSKNKSAAPTATVSTAKGHGAAGGGGGGTTGGGGANAGEYASLSHVPLCMSYDRGTATFHLEFLEGGPLSKGEAPGNPAVGGGCLVTCEVPGVAVADDVNDGPETPIDDEEGGTNSQTQTTSGNHNSGLAGAFRSSPLQSRAIFHSDALQSAVVELYDVPGASVVTVSLSPKGMELGTTGPRSEVWVNVPYHRGQDGLYVGLECYETNAALFELASDAGRRRRTTKHGGIVRKYPLGAFLSGMRGLDIGVETCLSINSRGMMAIQHQVSRDGYYDVSEDGGGGGKTTKPSFVDFIMTCIEEEDDEEGDGNGDMSQAERSVEMQQPQQRQQQKHNGLYDITNEDRSVSDTGRRKAQQTSAVPRAKRGRARPTPERDEGKASSAEEEEEQPTRRVRQKEKQYASDDAESHTGFGGHGSAGDFDFDDEQDHPNGDRDHPTSNHSPKQPSNNNSNHDTSRILEELEMDSDMLSSRRSPAVGQGRKNALEDLRRRRQEQMRQRQSLDYQQGDETMEKRDVHSDDDGSSDDNNEHHSRRRKISKGSKRSKVATSRNESRDSDDDANSDKNANINLSDDEDNDDTNANCRGNSKRAKYHHQHLNRAQDSQSQSQSDDEDDDDDGDETENELDVTAEIPQLFSKRSSLCTSRHGSKRTSSRGSRGGSRSSLDRNSNYGGTNDSDEEEAEPRMMYGDTKLEFTQDGYGSDGSF